jgi:hypothetical protein
MAPRTRCLIEQPREAPEMLAAPWFSVRSSCFSVLKSYLPDRGLKMRRTGLRPVPYGRSKPLAAIRLQRLLLRVVQARAEMLVREDDIGHPAGADRLSSDLTVVLRRPRGAIWPGETPLGPPAEDPR